jgi:hypothetical protein
MTSAALPSSAPAAASVGGQRNHDDLSADPFAGIKPTTNCKDASVARARRLERNRPIELRRRKKTREEELLHQRSVGFYVTFISEIRHHLNQQQSILQTLRSSITEYEESTLQIDNETSIILNNNQKLKGQWRKIVEANIREYKEAKKLRVRVDVLLVSYLSADVVEVIPSRTSFTQSSHTLQIHRRRSKPPRGTTPSPKNPPPPPI